MVVPSVPSTELVTVTVLFASAVPLNVGVVSDVRLSVLDEPRSEPAARSGMEGAAGAEVSIVIAKADEADDVLEAASVAVAVILWAPVVRVPDV